MDQDVELVLMNFRVPRHLKRQIKIEAARTGKSVQEIMEKLIKEHIDEVNAANVYAKSENKNG